MDTLKVLRAQEQAESCWKSFKERKLTKNNARENLLLNSDFNNLLQLLIDVKGSELAVKVAIDFVIKCIQAKIISPTALLTLIQHKLPGNNSCKITSIPVFSRISALILEIEKQTKINFAFQLASNDLRLVPFLIERSLSTAEIDVDSDFINFLLGDPDLVLTSSVFDDQHYKLSRCRVLSRLAENVEKDDYSDLLMDFLVWNSSRLCIMELGFISPISRYFAENQSLSSARLELFEVFVEVLCNEFFKFGSLGDIIEFICNNCSKLISEYSAFKICSLLILRKGIDSGLVCSILQLLSQYGALANFSKVCCAELMMKSSFDNKLESSMRIIFTLPITNGKFDDESLTEPFTELGMLSQLGFKGSRPQSASYEDYFDLVFLSKHLHDLSSIDLSKYLQKGYFETIFSLLAYKWNISNDEDVLKGFLKLLGDVENEDPEVKILRYSWIVDFFETHLTDEMYLNYLPLICEFVTNTDNILFAFVQQKISSFLSQKDNISVQLPCMLSLFNLFESSQTRQSRLNYLTTMALSYLHNIISQNMTEIDTRTVILAYKLIGKLAEIAVVDPRDIWIKYAEKFLTNNFLLSNSHVRGALFSFASSLRIIPEGSEGEINEIKFIGIKILLENLAIETDSFALDQICESFAKFDIEIARKVEVKLLQPEPTFDEDGNVKNIPVEDILSNSIIFNPLKLYEVAKRYNEPSNIYKKLWIKLIDHEVETMPRTKFLGSEEKASTVSEVKTKFISNPSFCNGLIFENFNETEFSNVDDVLKCVKSRLMPLVPSINSLMWYIRPLLPGFLFEAVDNIMKKVDDQRIKKQLGDYEYLLANLKTGTTPQSISTLIMIISSIMKSEFMNQNISENFLFSNWISILTKKLENVSEFKLLLGNEEFLGAFAISCNILSGCSSNIDSALCDALDSMILTNSKLKDGVSVYCAIEAASKLKVERIENILLDKSTSSKRKLIAGLSMIRLGRTFSEKLNFSDKTDDIALILEIISKKGQGSFSKTAFLDSLEFKGLALYVQSLISPSKLKEKSKQRAFDSGSVPAALKYDAILAYLLGSGMNMTTLTFDNYDNDWLKMIEDSTKDSKCLALLQMVSRSATIKGNEKSICIGLERFDKFSWLRFIGSIKSVMKYEILTDCKLLPRIEWSPVPIDEFNFVLKHVLSITPITKVPYINPSLLSCFFEHVIIVIKRRPVVLKRVIEVLYNNTDEKSSRTLCEIFDYFISKNDCSSLRFCLEECIKYPQDLLKTFDTCRFNLLNPETLCELSILLNSFVERLSTDPTKLAIINIDKFSVFKIIQNIMTTTPVCNELNNLKLRVLSVKIRNLDGKEKIKASIDVIDLMFIYQQEEEKFSILNELLYEIFEDLPSILFDSNANNDPEIVNKIRSRAAVIPKDIYDRLDSCFISVEYEKANF